MRKKISNSAERDVIEKELGLSFKFPSLYAPQLIIDGSEESTLSIVTMENTSQIVFAIWGILPSDYEEDWIDFQNVIDTLNTPYGTLNSHELVKDSFLTRRCLIIVTGFFVHRLHNGFLYPYYVHSENNKPITLAGVYNTLADGFITCSIITTQASGIVKNIQNLNTQMPVIIDESDRALWLEEETHPEILSRLKIPTDKHLQAHLVAKEFFKNHISYESVLEPVTYDDIPNL